MVILESMSKEGKWDKEVQTANTKSLNKHISVLGTLDSASLGTSERVHRTQTGRVEGPGVLIHQKWWRVFLRDVNSVWILTFGHTGPKKCPGRALQGFTRAGTRVRRMRHKDWFVPLPQFQNVSAHHCDRFHLHLKFCCFIHHEYFALILFF